VVSLTFLEAWRKRSRIEAGGESLRPWLLGIAVNVSRNLARASRRGDAQIPRDHDAPPPRAWCHRSATALPAPTPAAGKHPPELPEPVQS
jgi:DNA-directed RNA polymerase specialized sigma24 family protein